MTLGDLLSDLDAKQVQDLAKLWKVPYRSSDSFGKTVRQLCEAYTDSRIKEQLNRLDDEQRRSLDMLAVLFDASHQPMGLQEGSRKVNELLGVKGQGERMIRTLMNRGFLFLYKYYWHDRIFVPDEVWPVLHRQIAESAVKRILEQAAAGRVEETAHCGLAVHHDFLTLLSAIGHDRVEISQKGQIYKRTINKIMTRFRGTDTYFPASIEEKETQPRYFQFLSDFIERHELVYFEKIALLDPESIQAFMSVSYVEWTKHFYVEYLEGLYGEVHALPLRLIRSILYRLGTEAWASWPALIDELTRLMQPWGVSVTAQHLNRLFYDPLTAFGLIRRGKDERGTEVWKWTDWGKEYILRDMLDTSLNDSRIAEMQVDRFYVQPNLELVVPETILPAIRWQVEAIAELVRSDSALVYRFTRERTLQALESGWTLETIEAFLHRHGHTPPAANVMRTLQDWSAGYGKAVLWDVMVLEVKDKEIARLAKEDKKLAKLIVGMFSPQAFVIRRSDEQQVRKRIDSLGVMIPCRVANPDPRRESREHQAYDGEKEVAENSLLHNLSGFDPALMADNTDLITVASRQLVKHDLGFEDFLEVTDDLETDGEFDDDDDDDDDDYLF